MHDDFMFLGKQRFCRGMTQPAGGAGDEDAILPSWPYL
jgi:hypothetical protein